MKTRPIKDLLIIVRDNLSMLQTGMCRLVHDLAIDFIISNKERDIIIRYICGHKPNNVGPLWWWSIGNIIPRKNWLNEQIEKL